MIKLKVNYIKDKRINSLSRSIIVYNGGYVIVTPKVTFHFEASRPNASVVLAGGMGIEAEFDVSVESLSPTGAWGWFLNHARD